MCVSLCLNAVRATSSSAAMLPLGSFTHNYQHLYASVRASVHCVCLCVFVDAIGEIVGERLCVCETERRREGGKVHFVDAQRRFSNWLDVFRMTLPILHRQLVERTNRRRCWMTAR